MSLLRKIFGIPPKLPVSRPLNADEVAAGLVADPGACLFGPQGGIYVWEPRLLERMYFKVRGQPAGYVQEIEVRHSQKALRVGHFAVESGLEGKGAGKALAIWLGREVRTRYGLEAIHFAERSQKNPAYAQFFQGINAVPVPDPEPSIYPVWVWDITPQGGNVPP